ncbi:MAG: DUF3696 domain-containing protein, partial [Muribaculaceae bacterium]|nr:DUF3696 domain-containing protein [Muribaculaceae bacterium]
IKHISFDNFKCLSGKEFGLDKVNIFTGYNGRGKSSVMQAILMLSQSTRKDDINSFARLHVNGDFVKLGDFDELLTDPETLHFNLTLKILDNEDKERMVKLGYDMGDDFTVGLLSECNIDGISYFDTASSRPVVKEVNQNDEKGDLKPLPVFLYNQFRSQNIHYVAADRKGPVKFVERAEIPNVFKVGADGSSTIATLSAYHDTVDPEINVDPHDNLSHKLVEAVSMWLDYIMNGGSVGIVGNAIRNTDVYDKSKKSSILKIDFGVNDKGKRYPSYHVGFGYSYILSIVVTALIAKEKDIVIIENPEAHLHPEAQTRLTFLLAKLGAKGIQVFVETHSEHVISGFRLAALKKEYKLESKDIRIFFFDFDFSLQPLLIEPNGRIKNWPERFFDQYQKELVEILKLGAEVSH